MDEKTFQTELQKALDAINMLPKSETKDRLVQQAENMNRIFTTGKQRLKQINDSVDLLRVQVKYLLFDLEATKRENGYLRKMLDDGGAG